MNVFDIIGPVMIGPSSSHTAGAVRLGYVARKILEDTPVRAEIDLAGSFAQTYRGHGTDKALVAGILGFKPDDIRIRQSLELASSMGLDFSFRRVSIPGAHPNTARIRLTGAQGNTNEIVAASVGGGNILVTELNGMDVHFTGQSNTLVILHYDRPGTIAAATNFVAYSGVNIGKLRFSRPSKGGQAVMTIELDGEIPDPLIEAMRILPNVLQVIMIRKI